MITLGKLKTGLDTRTHPANTPRGSLVELTNALVTSGGEIEKRKAFVNEETLPAGTVGLRNLGGQLTTFGSGPRPAGLDASIGYERVDHPNGHAPSEVVSAFRFGGRAYVVVAYENGDVLHFDGGNSVSHWDTSTGGEIESLEQAASYIASRIDTEDGYTATASGAEVDVRGKDFVYEARVLNGSTGSVTDSVIQDYQAEVFSARAQGSFEITGQPGDYIETIKIGGVEVLGGQIDYTVNLSNTAVLIADQINAFSPYDASTSGNLVIIDAPAGSGEEENGKSIVFGGTLGIVSPFSMTGGADHRAEQEKVVRFSFSGGYEEDATYQIVLDGSDYSKYPDVISAVESARAHQNRVFAIAGEYLYFSALGDGSWWNPDADAGAGEPVGAGFLRITDYASEGRSLTAIAPWGKELAAFSERNVALMNIDPDPNNIGVGEILGSTGTKFPRSVYDLGGRDVLYLGPTGIRSLKSRASIDAPFSQDIGTPVNKDVVLATKAIGQAARRSVVAVADEDGRTWTIVGNQAFCLSFFPDAGVGAWSVCEMPGVVDDACEFGDTFWVRVGDEIYAYGGRAGDEYDDTEARVTTWFEDGDDPDVKVNLAGLAAIVRGAWGIRILLDPENLNVCHDIGTISEEGGRAGRIGFSVKASSYALNARTTHAGPAKISLLRAY